MPDIAGYDRDSVTVTLSLPATIPSSVDTGAAAYAILDAGEVTDAAPAATLRAGTIDPSLLASTPDANTTDPFIQDEAAQLDYNATNIFNYLHTQIGYNSYLGSVRGVRGTLWSNAGNALDVASLGVALMRASGIPAQYAQGTLTKSGAQALILSMFPASYQTVGYIPAGTQVADPANDPQLLSETESHYWFQYDTGSGMANADPVMPGATVGRLFASVQSTFTEVPDSLREKTEVSLNAEIYAVAAVAFGGGLATTTVLDQTFNDVDLVGRPITVGVFASSNTVGLTYATQTNNYEPYIVLGDEAFPDPSHDEVIHGSEFQEVLTDFPLGSSVLTGLTLSVTLSGPVGPAESYQRMLVDRIGYATRQAMTSATIQLPPLDTSAAPILNDYDTYTLNVLPGAQDSNVFQPLQAEANEENAIANSDPGAGDLALMAFARAELAQLAAASDHLSGNLGALTETTVYYDRPRLTLLTTGVTGDSSDAKLSVAIDLVREHMQAIVWPGQNPSAAIDFAASHGFVDSILEGQAFPTTQSSVNSSAAGVFLQSIQEGIPLVTVSSDNIGLFQNLDLPTEAKARIVSAVQSGLDVIVPAQSVLVNGASTTAWLEINPTTGDLVAVAQDGGHQEAIEYVVVVEIEETITYTIFDLIPTPIELKPVKEQAAFWAHVAAIALIPFDIEAASIVKDIGDFLTDLAEYDPSISPVLSVPHVPFPDHPTNTSSSAVSIQSNSASGESTGNSQITSVAVANQIAVSWKSNASTTFLVASLVSSGAEVLDQNGNALGSGAVALTSTVGVQASVSGNPNISAMGQGNVSVYAAATSIDVSTNWTNYVASVTGGATIVLTTNGLTLNGQVLPMGKYTIHVDSAQLSGSGPGTSASFSGAVSITADSATVQVSPGSGSVAVGGKPLDPEDEATLDNYSGTISVTASGGGSDDVALTGNAGNVLQVAVTPSAFTTDQNTPIAFSPSIDTSFADTYTFRAQGPSGWTVTTDENGNVTATPAPGTQTGTYPIQIIVQSTTNPDLIAQTTVNVAVQPTTAGSKLTVVPDPLLTVPYNGAQLPTAFQATIQNTGPTPLTDELTFSNLPSGFTILDSGTSVTVPAGQTGILGIYLVPSSGPVPAPGTQVSFTVTATSTSKPPTTLAQTLTFTIPNIDAVTLTCAPVSINTIPGGSSNGLLTITNAGNVPEDINLSSVASTGLTISGLADLALQQGQSGAETIGIATDSSVSLESFLQTTITASYGPSDASLSATLQLPVNVVVPGADAIADAGVAAGQLGYTAIAARLDDLSTALTNLVENPTSAVYLSQAVATINALSGLFTADAYLSALIPTLANDAAALAAATSLPDINSALSNLANDLGVVGTTLSDEVAHSLTIVLDPNQGQALPQHPVLYPIDIKNTGNEPTTYDFSVLGLPDGVTAAFNFPSVTLQPGQELFGGQNGAVLTVTETDPQESTIGFNVIATAEGAPEIGRSAPGALTVRSAFVQVASVSPNPSFTQAGGLVDVTARVLNVIANAISGQVYFTVTAPGGAVVFTSTPVAETFYVGTALATVDLGSFDTTGLSDGSYTITAVVTDSAGNPLSTVPGQASVTVGSPVTASLISDTNPADSDFQYAQNENTTLTVNTQGTFPAPLTLSGFTGTDALETGVAIDGNLAYVCGIKDISIVDITDPANPTVLSTFGSDVITQGGLNLCRISGTLLLVASENTVNSNFFNLLIYSIASPTSPTLISDTPINYHFFSDMYIQGSTVFFPLNGVSTFVGVILDDQFGDFVSVDFSDPSAPKLSDVLFNNRGEPDGGDYLENGVTAVNSQTMYVASTTSKGSNSQVGSGELLVVNTSDPTHMAVTDTLDIPDTVQLLDVVTDGDRALAIGSTGGYTISSGLSTEVISGTLTATLLNISNPLDPTIIGSTLVTQNQFFNRGQTTGSAKTDLLDLGDDRYAISDTQFNGQPVLTMVDATDPNHLITSVLPTSSPTNAMAVSGNSLYVTSQDGFSVYEIGQIVGVPLTVSVDLPTGTDVTYDPTTFSIAPSEIDHNNGFDTITWYTSLGSGIDDLTITWNSKLSADVPSGAYAVTLGGTVSYVSQGTTGILNLPATFLDVYRYSFVFAYPATKTVQPGQSANYTLDIDQDLSTPDTYNLSIAGLPSSWLDAIPTTVIGLVHEYSQIPLTITPDVTATPGAYDFTLSVTDGVVSDSIQLVLIVQGQPISQPAVDSHGIVVTLSPSSAEAGQGTSAQYTAELTNTGSADDSFTLSTAGLPSGIAAAFGQTTIDVPPGASNFRDVTLTLTPQLGAAAGTDAFQITATSTSLPPISYTASASLTVDSGGVSVAISPQSDAPGSPFDATLTNTGSNSDTFDLSLGGPAALVSTLGQSQVTLAPGASQMVSISTSAVNFADQGGLALIASATSETDPAIQADATATLSIPATEGLTAGLNPSVQVLPTPGSSSFLVMVNNTGNSEDSYTATITGTTGPLTATLTGLDGSPTQTISTFRLPGLSTGAILLQTSLTSFGQGTVTVQVSSQTQPTESASVTAMVKTAATPSWSGLSAPTISFGTAGVTLSGEIGGPASLIPSGNVAITLDGVTETAAIDTTTGDFSASFNTAALGVAASPYTVSYSYAGDENFAAGRNTTTLTVNQAAPTVTWATPADITYGKPLGAAQLDATASVAGTFAYSPALGTVLGGGQGQTLSVLFTPTDSADYSTVPASVMINVSQARPSFTNALSAPTITFGTANVSLSGQIDASGSPIPSGDVSITVNGVTVTAPIDTATGDFSASVSTAAFGVASSPYTIHYSFPATVDFMSATRTTVLTVNKATPTLAWATPASITDSTPLSSAQLDATASVAGTFVYTPAAGTILHAGQNQTLSVLFKPADSADYATAGTTTTIAVSTTENTTSPVTITAFQVRKVQLGKKGHKSKTFALFVQFSGALDTSAAQNVAAYTVFSGKINKVHKVPRIVYNKRVPLSQAVYISSTNSVILFPRGKHILPKFEQLQVNVSLLTDPEGRPINNGKNFTASVARKGLVVSTSAVLRPSKPGLLRLSTRFLNADWRPA